MKLLMSKEITHKIVIALVIVILFNFIAPKISFASVESVLLNPIMSFLTAIGDGIMSILQGNILGIEDSFYTLSKPGFWAKAGHIAAIVAGVALGVVVTVGLAAISGGTSLIAQAISAGGVAAAGIGVSTFVATTVASISLPTIAVGVIGGIYGYSLADKAWGANTISLPIFALTPEEIILGKIAMLDVNFINPNKYEKVYLRDSLGNYVATDGTTIPPDENGNPSDPSRAKEVSTKGTSSVALELQGVIAKWYVALRNLAIVILLLILVYVGIRMIISSAVSEKAKYKQMLMDWVVAMCLLFCLHYIMSFALSITDSLNKLFQKQSYTEYVELPSTKDYEINGDGLSDEEKQGMEEIFAAEDGFIWPTNLMGRARLEMQLTSSEDAPEGSYDDSQIGYTMIYIVLIIYTIMFLFIYIKRVLYIAFLTLIAPLVAMTYPIDKMHDGKAQAFNMWLKEYIFTLLIQPVHALIYTVFVSMAVDFAKSNVIYTLVCIGFILQAENIIRKFFGFEKAGAFPIINHALGGAMVMQGVNMLKGKGKGKDSSNAKKSVRMQGVSASNRGDSLKNDPIDALSGGTSGRSLPGGGSLGGGSSSGGSSSGGSSSGGSSSGGSSSGGSSSGGSSSGGSLGGGSSSGGSLGGGSLSRGSSSGGSSSRGSSSGGPSGGGSSGSSSSKKKPKRIRGTLKTAGKYMGAPLLRGATGVLRGATRLPLAATLGTVGVAAGLASDKGGNVLTYGAAGAGIGYGLSKTQPLDADAMLDDARREIYGEDYKEHMNELSDKAFMRDGQSKADFKEEFGDRYKEKMKVAMKYRENGVTDNSLIMRAMKAPGNFGEEDSDKRIALAKLASQVPATKDLKELKARLSKKGIPDGDVDEIADAVRYIKKFNF